MDILKSLDRTLGRFLVALISSFRRSRVVSVNPGDVKSLLVIRPGGIGDAFMLLPIIEKLREEFSSIEIDILSEKRNFSAFLLLGLKSVYLYEKPLHLLRLLLFKRYDVIIDTEQWHRLSAIFAFLLHPKLSYGFSTNERKRLLSNPVAYDIEEDERVAFLKLFDLFFGDKIKDISSLGRISPLDIPLGIPELVGKKRLIGVSFGSTRREKCWDIANWSILIEKLVEKGYDIVLLGGSSDIKDAERIKMGKKQGITNLVGKLSWIETASVVKRLSLVISIDSGILHLARILGVSTVGLFGPTDPRKWAPEGVKSRVIWGRPHCSPCSRFAYIPPCPYNIRCMKEIEVEDVEERTLEIMESEA